ncbi:MlaD family protein [Flavobacterium sp. UBA6135]|uniref:MlaD family protein n=1 Tax=Flavobacterium sp. UBA6135 TaxID=1946553 RepID=UPI0025C57AC7|nr:MlaD family protein [Flavobacterium sp. UBA6135]
MKEHSQNFKIRLGLFIAIGIFLFVVAIFLIGKQKNLFNPVYSLTTTFYNVSGLQVGNKVRFSGINVGTVDAVTIINDSTVSVTMFIKKDVQKFIKTNSEVSIGSEGLIGDKLLQISQGTSNANFAKDGAALVSNEPIELDEIVASLKVTAENAEIISDELAEIMIAINSGEGTLGRLINDPKIAENLSQTMSNLESSSKGLDENMEAAKENFLLRGFFKRKERATLKAKKAAEEKKEKERKIEEEKKKAALNKN